MSLLHYKFTIPEYDSKNIKIKGLFRETIWWTVSKVQRVLSRTPPVITYKAGNTFDKLSTD
jgi:hypothetical protein